MFEKKVFLVFVSLLVVFIGLVGGTLAEDIFTDDFESGTISGWSVSHTGTGNDWYASSDTPYAGSYLAQVTPQDAGEVSDMYRVIDTSGYSSIKFSYYRKLSGLDTVDWFRAKWFDGTSWSTVEEQNSANDGSYVYKEFSLGGGADDNANFQIKFECIAGAISEHCRVDNVNISGIQDDSTSPQFSNIGENPVNGSTYNAGQFYEFNVTITEDNLEDFIIEFDGVNYTSEIYNSSNVYFFNRTDLIAGTYIYYWWANDTNGNAGKSQVKNYVIIKNPFFCDVLFNESSPTVYSQPFRVYSNCNTAFTLYRNGSIISNNSLQNLARNHICYLHIMKKIHYYNLLLQ